tara:strand:- start:112 stop:315 length:204 start_codon:yes stop_codon:yes gene_type:complete
MSENEEYINLEKKLLNDRNKVVELLNSLIEEIGLTKNISETDQIIEILNNYKNKINNQLLENFNEEE